MNERTFHIYKKNSKTTEVIRHSVTTDELEQMIAKKEIDWKHWEIEPCYTEYSAEDASF
tara:strand:+ start:1274 stop:1450 length:177 start_codon:yes stop_codon:yes gene_type:complete